MSIRSVSIVLLCFGVLITSYLSYLKLAGQESVCLSGGMINCEAVLNSRFSEINLLGSSVPIAYLGWFVYVILIGIWIWEDSSKHSDIAIALFFGLNTFAWLYSVYLVYLQFFVLRAACPWCLSHEANITLIFGLTLLRLKKYIQEAD